MKHLNKQGKNRSRAVPLACQQGMMICKMPRDNNQFRVGRINTSLYSGVGTTTDKFPPAVADSDA